MKPLCVLPVNWRSFIQETPRASMPKRSRQQKVLSQTHDLWRTKSTPLAVIKKEKCGSVSFKEDLQVIALMWLAVAHLIPKGCPARPAQTSNTLPYLQFASARRRRKTEDTLMVAGRWYLWAAGNCQN